MVNYLSHFSPVLVEVQLRELDKDRVSWSWTEYHQAGYEKEKEVISSAPVLTLFDIGKRHRVTTDASRNTLGATLLQEQGAEWQPVAYASKKMTEAETRYGHIEKEAWAMTWACEKFDFYLVGRAFEGETDHKPLVPLLGGKELSDLPLIIQRFRTRLMRYSYTIFHTAGTQMFLADLLSRPASPRDSVQVTRVERQAMAVVLAEDDALLEEMREATAGDEDYRKVLQAVESGWPGDDSGEVRKVRAMGDSLSIVDGLVLMNVRLYIPKELRRKVLEKLYTGHQGVVHTTRRAIDTVWWLSVRQEVARMVENCSVCVRERRMVYQRLNPARLPARVWEEIAVDLFELEGSHFALFVDYLLQWIEVEELREGVGKENEAPIHAVGVPRSVSVRQRAMFRVQGMAGPDGGL